MDTIIQGQTQSALVQKLSETEHNVKRLTHDIPDQAPLVSMQTLELEPYAGDINDENTTFRFRVPRRGYLNRMFMKCFIKTNTLVHHKFDPSTLKHSGMETFGIFFEYASLIVNGKRVETLYPESIMYNTSTHDSNIVKHLKVGLGGRRTHDVENQTSIEFSNTNIKDGTGYGDFKFLIPLEFSLFKFFKDSVDTNLIGNIEIEFKKKAMLGLKLPVPVAHIETRTLLSCCYHNFKNTFRTNLRNANYKREVTSFLHVDSVPVPEGVYKEIEGLAIDTMGSYTFNLDGSQDISDIIVSFTQTHPTFLASNNHNGEYSVAPGIESQLRFILRSNGKVLLDKNHYELINGLPELHSSQLQDYFKPSNALSFNKFIAAHYIYRTDQDHANLYRGGPATAINYPSYSIMVIPFSLFGTDEFYNGVLSLKSLTNVELEIRGQDLLQAGANFSEASFERTIPKVVLRTKSIARIDGKTGNVHV